MDYTIRFYKTKYNTQNRAYDKQAFANVYPLNTAYEIALPHIVIPDTTIYVNNEVGIELITKGYNYCVFNYGGVDYYSFIVQYVPNIASNSYGVVLRTDVWLTFVDKDENGKYNIALSGIIERAHVNEFIKEDNKITPTNTYYLDTVEEPYLETTFRTSRQKAIKEFVEGNTHNDYAFLYVIRNYGIDKTHSKSHYENELNNIKMFSNITLSIYPIVKSTGTILNIVSGGETYYNTVDYTEQGTFFNINDITDKDYIVSMVVAESIDPHINVINNNVVKTSMLFDFPNFNITLTSGTPEIYKDSNGIYTIQLRNYGLCNSFTYDEILDDNDTTYFRDTEIRLVNDYNRYLHTAISKAHTTIYKPMALSFGSVLNIPSIEVNKTDRFSYGYDIMFNSCYLKVESDRIKELSAINTHSVTYQFSPNVNDDYWTRLNANNTMANAKLDESISTNLKVKSTFKMIDGAIKSISGGVAAATSGNPLGVAQATQSFIGGAIDASTSMMQADKIRNNAKYAQECAERTLNEGLRTLDIANIGSICYSANDVLLMTTTVADNDAFEDLLSRLHKFGYITNIPLDNYFTKHKRESFNFVMCNMVQVAGSFAHVNNLIAEVLTSGCTFWSTEPMNYNVTNYQVNIKEV